MEEDDKEWIRWGERKRTHALARVKLFKCESIYGNAMSLVRPGARAQCECVPCKPRRRQSSSQLTSNIFIGSSVTFNLTYLFGCPGKVPSPLSPCKRRSPFWPHVKTPSQINTKARSKKKKKESERGAEGLRRGLRLHRLVSEACVMMRLFKEHLKWKARTILFDRLDSLLNSRGETGQGQQRHEHVHAGLATNVQRDTHKHKLQEHLQRGFPALSMWSRGVETDVAPSL